MAPPSNLLTLPNEIRDKIIRYCMVISAIDLDHEYSWLIARYPIMIITTNRPSPQASAQLLRCCKQLYREALPILYGDNILSLSSYEMNFDFYDSRKFYYLSILPMVKHVCFSSGSPNAWNTREMLKEMPKLRSWSMGGLEYGLKQDDKELVKEVKTIVRSARNLFKGIAASPRDIKIGLVTRADQPGKRWSTDRSWCSKSTYIQY